ncbi:MAG: hypothetical protein ABIN01_07245 [Ferruginibacter sp.]
MGNSNVLFEFLFQRKLSEPGAQEFLTQVATDNPYFSAAHFFLLLKTAKGTAAYEQQAAKTSVLFNNPWWLQFQLQENEEATDEVEIINSINDNSPVLQAKQDKLEAVDINVREQKPDEMNVPGLNVPEIAQETVPTAIDINEHEEALTPTLTEPALLSSEIPSSTLENTLRLVANNNTNADYANYGEQFTLENQVDPVQNELFDLSLSETVEQSFTQDEKKIDEEFTVANTDVNDNLTEVSTAGHFNNDADPLVNEPETEENINTEREIAPLNFKLNLDTSNTTEDTIVFEPLHTSDYFASLGIKLSAEIPASDKLGKHLKSFTDWLKTMKKIHGDQMPQSGGESDTSIQKLAEQSNKEAGVVTEAMADVLLHQGKANKAIEVYKKLSLLNPSKSAYFAAKIDQLKEH